MMEGYSGFLKHKGYSVQTQKTYSYRVHLFVMWLNERKVSKLNLYFQVIKYIEYLQHKGISKRTISGDLIAIKKYFAFKGIELALLPITKIKGIQKTIPRYLLSKKQLEELYTKYDCDTSNLWNMRDKVIVGLFVFQGLSKGELQEIKIEDIDFAKSEIWIRGKSRSNSRKLELDECQIEALSILVNKLIPLFITESKSLTAHLLFTSSLNKDLRNVLPMILKKLRLIEMEVIGWNQIRASVLCFWTETISTRKVQYMAGHRYIGSTERYVQNQTLDLIKQIEIFSPNL